MIIRVKTYNDDSYDDTYDDSYDDSYKIVKDETMSESGVE